MLMCHFIQLLVLFVLGILLADQLDTAVLALQTNDKLMVIASGWEIVTTLWMLPLMGFVLAMFLVMLFNRITGANSACCSSEACNTAPKGEKMEK
jgi:phosphate/sulfate permease